MSIVSLLAYLIIPLYLCLTLMAIGLVLALFRWRKTGLAVALAGMAWAYAWSLPATSLWLGGMLEQAYPYRPPNELPTADAIVVLGGNIANDRQNWFLPYDRETAIRRFRTAEQLYDAGRAPKIVLSGGALSGDVSEAEGMAHALRLSGVPRSAMILENDSRTTYENAILTENQLKEHNIRTVLLVTSALHMPRAMAAFRKQGITAIPAPSQPQIVLPESPRISPWLPHERAFDASRSIIKEYTGLFVYWLRGWI
ncbi:YdcF family protein [Bordetella genomosp. 9]|uniref:DUF218 domain-containing protein n=1 Tax=Bordetella genomosp. 9 TaxID=1416803 RepID=A0A1W6YYD7_9BORD|nr:YdcF family protein [Bordetella genomosp. 9]ARP86115.1 hypothetical protein CAL13_07780 [Bordetella genomosp. 9]ARP90136.1 hypothetical protein CAL14_07390 [Bordetella genomosp. 9]